MAKQFQLWVTVIRWIDGDTFLGVLDQGRYVFYGTESKPRPFRCSLINAPELPTPEGLAAADHARLIIPPGDYECISTGLDEYGRPLLDLITSTGRFSQVMIDGGWAVPYKR